MSQVGNPQNRFSGPYAVQDQNHMGEMENKPQRTQSQQSDNSHRQQGGEQPSAPQQGGTRKSRLL